MKAIILAAGRGSRMKNLTRRNPKCLLELGGKPLIETQLSSLKEAGIDEIGLVTGYKSGMLKKYGKCHFHNKNWESTQMVYSLMCASEWLESESCIISYSDIFYTADVVTALKLNSAKIALSYDPNWLNLWSGRFDDPLSDAETFRLNEDNTVAEIGQRPKTLEHIMGQYMGLLKFEPDGWAFFRKTFFGLSVQEQNTIHMTGMLQKLIEHKEIPISAVQSIGKWGEIDSQSDFEYFNQIIKEKL